MSTIQNTSLDTIGITAISSGIVLLEAGSDLELAAALIVVGFASVLIKYYFR